MRFMLSFSVPQLISVSIFWFVSDFIELIKGFKCIFGEQAQLALQRVRTAITCQLFGISESA
jgi:hypothetical protein